MSEILTQNSDIYEILFNESLDGLVVNNTKYYNYILYNSHKIYIQNELIDNLKEGGNELNFILDDSSQVALLGFKSNIPSYVLADEDNEQSNSPIYSYNVSYDNDETTNYENIQLTYQADNNYFTDIYNNSYDLLSDDFENNTSLIRHFKIIRINTDSQNNTETKYFVYGSSNNLIGCFDNENEQEACINILRENGKYVYGITEISNIRSLSQDPRQYENVYTDKSISIENNYNDNTLTFGKYYSITELQDFIKDQSNISTYNYLSDINENFANNEEFVNQISELIEHDSVYIRFAPTPKNDTDNIKKKQNIRILKLNNIYTYDIDKLEDIAENSEMPIFNDNLFY